MTVSLADQAAFFIACLRHHRVGYETYATATETPIETVIAMMNGRLPIPTWIKLTVIAVKEHLYPVGSDDVNQDVATGTTMAARLAMAAFKWQEASRKPLHAHQRHVLRAISVGRYYRAGKVWRARPVLGKNFPTVTPKMIAELTARALIRTNDRTVLELTATGKRETGK